VSVPRPYTANILPEYITCVQDGVVHVHLVVTVYSSVFEPNTTINPPWRHFHRFISILCTYTNNVLVQQPQTYWRNNLHFFSWIQHRFVL